MHELQKVRLGHIAARNGDDAPVIRQAALPVEMIERRNELATGKIAPAAKDDHIERM